MKENPSTFDMADDYEVPPGWAPAAAFDSAHLAHEAGLAILAMGHAYWLLPSGERYILCVTEDLLPSVTKELDKVREIGRMRLHRSESSFYKEREIGLWSFVIYALLLCGCFVAQNFAPLLDAGRVDAALMIDQAEWWRAFTALTLHGDVVHLVSNLVAGIGFAILLARYFGEGVGWFLILLAGVFGNMLNAWIQYPETHFSIGASTAVFGALGLITGVALWIALKEPAERWAMPRWLLPAFGGFTLLGLLGVGDGIDGRIDVAAHICGFICGGLLGFICAICQQYVAQVSKGRWVGVCALLLLAAAWGFALN